MDYNQVIGNERVIEGLKRAIRKGSISHSYIFHGEEGIGKKKIAHIFAKTLLCKEEGEEPCNKCTSCLKFNSENHPDFIAIEPEKGLIKKGQAEDLVKSISTAPFESKRKVFIINDSHKMNLEAKNTLLKTLEEPPIYINIILITSSLNNLLPTIISRCQNIKFYPVDSNKISSLLYNLYKKDMEEAKFIADFSQGSVGKSIEIAKSEEFFNKRDKIINIIDALIKGDKTKALNSIGFFKENKENLEEILDLILIWFRDLLIYKEIGNSQLIINKDKLNILSGQTFINNKQINDIIIKVEETKENIKRNINFQLSIETMLLKIQED